MPRKSIFLKTGPYESSVLVAFAPSVRANPVSAESKDNANNRNKQALRCENLPVVGFSSEILKPCEPSRAVCSRRSSLSSDAGPALAETSLLPVDVSSRLGSKELFEAKSEIFRPVNGEGFAFSRSVVSARRIWKGSQALCSAIRPSHDDPARVHFCVCST